MNMVSVSETIFSHFLVTLPSSSIVWLSLQIMNTTISSVIGLYVAISCTRLLSCCLYKLLNSPAELCKCSAAVLEAALGVSDGSGGSGAALGWVGDGSELLALFAEGGGGSAGALAELCGAGADLAGGGDDGVEIVAGVVWSHGPVLSWKWGGLNSCGAQGR